MERYTEANAVSRQRLRDLLARLDDDAYQRRIGEAWTIGAVLAHLAFWDQSCVARWEEFDRNGSFTGLSSAVIDVVNASSLPIWRAIPGRVVAELAVQAAEAADARVENVTKEGIAYIQVTGRTFFLDRAGHRHEHLDQIEGALA